MWAVKRDKRERGWLNYFLRSTFLHIFSFHMLSCTCSPSGLDDGLKDTSWQNYGIMAIIENYVDVGNIAINQIICLLIFDKVAPPLIKSCFLFAPLMWESCLWLRRDKSPKAASKTIVATLRTGGQFRQKQKSRLSWDLCNQNLFFLSSNYATFCITRATWP